MNESKKHVSFLNTDEEEHISKLSIKSGGKIQGDVSTEAVKDALRLGLISRFNAFTAVAAIFRGDSRKPRASEVVEESES